MRSANIDLCHAIPSSPGRSFGVREEGNGKVGGGGGKGHTSVDWIFGAPSLDET